jgi:hypothetical protein
MAIDPHTIPCDSKKMEIHASLPGYMRLLLWIFADAVVGAFFYIFSTYMPDFVIGLALLVAVFIIWYDRDFPKRTSTSYVTLLFWLPIILGLFCGFLWKMTGQDVWLRIGVACICVRAVNRIIGRVIRLSLTPP